MASHSNREPLIWAGCVLGLAAVFVLAGLLTPKRVHVPHGVPEVERPVTPVVDPSHAEPTPAP